MVVREWMVMAVFTLLIGGFMVNIIANGALRYAEYLNSQLQIQTIEETQNK